MAPNYSNLEAIPRTVHELPTDTDHNDITGAEDRQKSLSLGPDAELVGKPNRWYLRRELWLVLAVVCLVIIVIILGAVLGVRLHDLQPNATQTSVVTITATATATGTPSATPTSIRQNSGLAVTGWRSGSDFSIRLFYQGDDSYLRLSAFESGTGVWTGPSIFVKGKLGTPIAASNFDQGTVRTLSPLLF